MRASAAFFFASVVLARPSFRHLHRRQARADDTNPVVTDIVTDIITEYATDIDWTTDYVTVPYPSQAASTTCTDEDAAAAATSSFTFDVPSSTASATSPLTFDIPSSTAAAVSELSSSMPAPSSTTNAFDAAAPIIDFMLPGAPTSVPPVPFFGHWPPTSNQYSGISTRAPASAPSAASAPYAMVVSASTSDVVSAAAVSTILAPALSAPASSAAALAPSAVSSQAAPIPAAPAPQTSSPGSSSGKYPFTQMIVFGDNLSDNGNGSYAHGVSGNPANIYGFGTWTDGPIAASYLVNELGVPLVADYAFGHSDGGANFGATIDNSFTKSNSGAPSVKDQIANYSSSSIVKDTAESSLHFLWIGNNDALPFVHIDLDDANAASNQQFVSGFAAEMVSRCNELIAAGAKHIFVPNIYPRHIAPVTTTYFTNDTSKINNYGTVISNTNAAVATALKPMSDQVIVYDVFGFMEGLWNNAASNGITHTQQGADWIDGNPTRIEGKSAWEVGVTDKQGGTFYWMQWLDPTSHVHSLIADDMAKAIETAFSV